ncbi:DUF2306 domain-containing protein [Hymenobacter busanensis]|uniref:DUF2306 domain-containing protein n=1 Tax=Hymenobacter busanensis TaxID=2607656 RepID=A0A7L4ZSS0_9BACT|nr:DUF2306 domain-containing protein [Hymenobacter busanensis]KAA9327514.1 DUF2306 domain-containing protein [Hymenobacter busanensis]QHJ06148.1 DUF2306 domain-containing protein [Hymenobacter busanensis]
MSSSSAVYRSAQIGAGVAVALFTGLMLKMVLPYLSFEPGIHFLTTKSAAINSNTVFRTGFYTHITSSWWVLLTGLLQFFPALWRKRRKVHQQLGKIYVASILALAAPSGLILAFYANGGLSAKVGFTLQCVVWWLCTWQAYRLARQRQWEEHIKWMLRSFLVTLAAMSLRLESYTMFYLFGTKPIETYLTVVWLSWTGNLLLAEVLIQAGAARRLLRDFYQSQPNARPAHLQPLTVSA